VGAHSPSATPALPVPTSSAPCRAGSARLGWEELFEQIDQRGWGVECIAWWTIAVEGDGEQDLYLFEITPKNSQHNNCYELRRKSGKSNQFGKKTQRRMK